MCPPSLEESIRLDALNQFEHQARQKGYVHIAGVDEAGRGPLAGPVVAAACILPEHVRFEGINDSKQLSALERQRLFEIITSAPHVHYGIGIVDSSRIDLINILNATLEAMCMAIDALQQQPDYVLVDGNRMPKIPFPGEPLIKGDARSQSIASASIIAKQTRDQLMMIYHKRWPHYGFDEHKGYGTLKHRLALDKHGPCPIHRLTFAPLKNSS